MNKLLLIFTIGCFNQAQAADELRTYSSEQNKFSIHMPSGWEMMEQADEDVANPVNMEILEPMKQASLLVMVPKDGKANCVDTLKAMDESRKKKNILKPDQMKMSAGLLKDAKADDGSMGEYLIEGKGPGFPVVQKNYCFKSKDQIRIVTIAYQKAKVARFEPLFKKVISTFEFNQ
jgi:hypothetical protein